MRLKLLSQYCFATLITTFLPVLLFGQRYPIFEDGGSESTDSIGESFIGGVVVLTIVAGGIYLLIKILGNLTTSKTPNWIMFGLITLGLIGIVYAIGGVAMLLDN